MKKKSGLTVISVLKKLMFQPSFSLGILLAVAALQSMGHLGDMANILNDSFNGKQRKVFISLTLLLGFFRL